jgi:hypothetical protein
VHTYPLPIHATRPGHFILLDFTTRTIFRKEYISISSLLCIYLHFPVTWGQGVMVGVTVVLLKGDYGGP